MIETLLESSALFSDDLKYRYLLTRRWARDTGNVLFIMLNPSTADAEKFDPTVRRCYDFAHAWGFGGMAVCNLFALRATNPKELKKVDNPVGEDNDYVIECAVKKSILIIAAWGEHGTLNKRDQFVVNTITQDIRKPVHCLSMTKNRNPGHPLYLSGKLRPFLFKAERMLEEDY